MPEAIVATGRLARGDGSPVAGAIVALEAFLLKEGWRALARPKTDSEGRFEIEVRSPGTGEAEAAPFLRLADARGRPIVGAVEVASKDGTLVLDYGTVTAGAAEGDESLRLAEVRIRSLEGGLQRAEAARVDMMTSRDAASSERDRLAERLAVREALIRDAAPAGRDIGRADVALEAPIGEVASREVARLKLQLVGAETAAIEKGAKADSLARERDAALVSRDEARAELATIRTSAAAAPRIADLAGTVARSFETSQLTGGMEIADARVTLRGVVEAGGERFKPLDAAELTRVDASAASELSFAVRPSRAPRAGDAPAMPDLVGLTPGSARRVLRPLGRRVEVIEAPGTPAGAVLRHLPAAGEALPAGGVVRLVVATGTTGKEDG